MGLPSPERARTWGGRLVVDRDGARIGTITQIYTDDVTGLPEWATTRLGEATVFLPLLDAHEQDGAIQVQVKRDDVAKAPMVGPGRRISEKDEERLYRWYGIPYTPPPKPGPDRRAALTSALRAGVGDRGLRPVLVTVAAVLAAVAAVAVLVRTRPRPDRSV